MKKLIKVLPLIIGICLLGYSIYVYFTASGFKLLEVSSSIGRLYASTYKYAAVIGIAICIIYIAIFISKAKKKKSLSK